MTTIVKPRALRQGDTIGIVAPASNLKPEMLTAGLRELESLGFRTRVRADILEIDRYTAGSAARRIEEIHSMALDPEIRAIFCARGGYGSGQLLPLIDWPRIQKDPKIFCGSSDITMLLAGFQTSGLVAFHGPMVAASLRQGPEAYDRDLLLGMLVEGVPIRFPTSDCRILSRGLAQGRLTGGCLSLVVSTLGTPWEVDTSGAILLLEDVDCKPYQIERMLTHLRQAGKFEQVQGLVFGEMIGSVQHPDQGYTIEDVIHDAVRDLKVPVLFGFPTGHTSGRNVVVPFGISARLALDETSVFELLESAVST